MSGSDGHTLDFTGGGLGITTTTGNGFDAAASGTIDVTGTGNTIASTTGTALKVVNTDIGASNATFQSISAAGGTNGLVLNNTDVVSTGHLAVTGNGGTCTPADTSGCSGGTIPAPPAPTTPATAGRHRRRADQHARRRR